MTRIYLDWNIITNLINPERIKVAEIKQEFVFLKNIFENPKNEFIIPYSNAHLDDLMTSYNQGERDRVYESLSYIGKLTKNVCLTQYWNEEHSKWHLREPNEYFNSILEDKSSSFTSWDDLMESLKEFGMDKIYDMYKLIPHGMNMQKIETQSPFFASLFPRAKESNTMHAFIEDTFDMFSKMSSNPTVYKELRKMFKDGLKIDPNMSNYENVIETIDEYLPKTMLKKSFTELYTDNTFHKSKNKDYDKIIRLYMQLDFVGYNSDKVSKKNKYSNIFNDSIHCFYAAHCNYYITNDKLNNKKSKAVYEDIGVHTKVFTTKEFINYIQNQDK